MSTITFEIYGRILARLLCRRGAQLAEVLAELGVDRAELERDEPALRRELSDAWPNRRGISAMKFTTALATELTALDFLAADPEARQAAPAPGVAKPEVALPSFLQPASLPGSSPAAGPAPSAPLPAAPPEAPMRNRPPAHLTGTAEADLSAIIAGIRGGALPFSDAPRAPPAPPPPTSPAAPAPPPPTSGSTQALPVFDVDFERYPLELYARVTGALARGEPRDSVLAAHALSPDLFDKIARAWTARFTGEPALLARFREIVHAGAAPGPQRDGKVE